MISEILKTAKEKKLKIACAESCTGGLVGAALTELPGSSEIFNGSAVTYSNEAKKNILGVKENTLKKFRCCQRTMRSRNGAGSIENL